MDSFFLDQCKDKGEYEEQFIRVADKMTKLKHNERYHTMGETFHAEFLPVYLKNKKTIEEKVLYELEHRPNNIDRLPRTYSRIFNDYIYSLVMLENYNKIDRCLEKMYLPCIPNWMHINTIVCSFSRVGDRVTQAGEILQRYKSVYRMERYSTYARRYTQACLFVLQGYNATQRYAEALRYILQYDLLSFVKDTSNGALLTKILKIVLLSGDREFFKRLKDEFLADFSSRNFPYKYYRKELLRVLITYNTKIENFEEIAALVKNEEKDPRTYLLMIKLLYTVGKSAEVLENFLLNVIPSEMRNSYHFSYLIRKYADVGNFVKVREFFNSIPDNRKNTMLYEQYLRALILERKPKQNIVEALEVFNKSVDASTGEIEVPREGGKTKKKAGTHYSNPSTFYMLLLLKEAGMNTQMEQLYASLKTPSVRIMTLMQTHYERTGQLGKAAQIAELTAPSKFLTKVE